MHSPRKDSKLDQASESFSQGRDTPSPPPEDGGDETGLYELLLAEMGRKCAREVREFAREASRYGENSYSYKMNLLMVGFLRLGSRMPKHFATAIAQANDTLDATLEKRLDDFLGKIEAAFDHHHRPTNYSILSNLISNIRHPVLRDLPDGILSLSQSSNASQHRTGAHSETRFQGLRRIIECFLVRHVMLIVCGMGVLMLFIGATFYWKERLTLQQARNRDIFNMASWQHDEIAKQNAWRVEQAALIARERERNLADAQRQIIEQTNDRFQALVPTTYQLAQQLENTARKVHLQGEPQAWEVTLTEKQGLIDQHLEYNDYGSVLKLYLRIEPDRLVLSATAPSEERTRAKDGAKSGGR